MNKKDDIDDADIHTCGECEHFKPNICKRRKTNTTKINVACTKFKKKVTP